MRPRQGGLQGERARLLERHRHVGEAVADGLVGGERAAELHARPRVVDGGFEQRVHRADRFRAPRRQRALDRVLDMREGAFRQPDVASFSATLLKMQRGERRPIDGRMDIECQPRQRRARSRNNAIPSCVADLAADAGGDQIDG